MNRVLAGHGDLLAFKLRVQTIEEDSFIQITAVPRSIVSSPGLMPCYSIYADNLDFLDIHLQEQFFLYLYFQYLRQRCPG